ncbi:restriction endonuclease subunit S [Paraburkholderia sp. A3RO-2L]|uniref:restriction endonuclease subunit S n=1 Tax=Paraburkholderia sp. A3RO-2L TaxID=3028376 RepID=UPI003DA9CBE1
MNNEKRTSVPRLRFPGYLGDWASSPMSEVYSFKGNNSLSRDKLNYESGSFRNIHYGDIHTKFALHFRVDSESVPYINDGESHSAIRPENYCAAGDMVFADASEDMADIGKAIEIIETGDVPLVSGLHTILAKSNGVPFALGFGAYLFSSEGVRKQIQREAQGAKVLGLSASRLGNVQLHYPSDIDEQQKIADFVSSLDKMIVAENQKLDALKIHKRGLMQLLFPLEGEAVPRLRFPEFRNAKKWDLKSLGDISTVVRGGSPRPIDGFLTKAANGLNWLKIGDVDKEAKYVTATQEKVRPEALSKTREVCPGDLILSNSMSFGRPYLMKIKSCIHDGWIAITNLAGQVSREYLYYLIFAPTSQSYFLNNAAGGGVLNLNAEIIKALPVAYPSMQEQQKIAGSLACLDELIDAQVQRIGDLKTNKRGLMQQLFPAIAEVQV